MIERLVPAASSYAADVDFVFTLIFALVGFWLLLCEGVLLGLVVRFRRREGRPAQWITGEIPSQKRWVSIPHLLVLACDLVIIFFAVRVWYEVKQDLPPAEATVRVIAQQWAWSFEHPGPDGRLDTADDIRSVDELHVEKDKLYHFELSSRDVLHSFSVPAFRLKQDVIPGREITAWFEPTRPGTYDLQCAEICGIGHALMPARVVVETAAQHAAWMSRHAPALLADARPGLED